MEGRKYELDLIMEMHAKNGRHDLLCMLCMCIYNGMKE